MHAPREIRRWLNRMRRRYGKPNGVVRSGNLDYPKNQIKGATSKRLYRREDLRNETELHEIES